MSFRRLKVFKDILFFLLFLTLPFQIGRHFWLKESFIFGLKVDYLSPVFYLQDIFIFLLIFLEVKENYSLREIINAVKLFKNNLNKKALLLLTILFFLGLNIIFAEAKTISFYWWFRFIEFFSLGIVIAKNSKKAFKILLLVLPFVVFFEFVVGILQVFSKSSLGGIFWFFGERSFNIHTPGIARGSFLGKVFLRPYATFSHPNSMSGFILVCVALMLGKEKKNSFVKVSLLLGIFLIVLSFSRTAWLALSLICLFYILFRLFAFFKGHNNRLTFSYILILFSSFPLFYLFSKTTLDSSSVEIRLKLSEAALKLIGEKPFLGVGAGNFVVSLSQGEQVWQWLYWLQPVHNIFLLLSSELGLFLGILFILFYFQILFNLVKSCRLEHSGPSMVLAVCLFSVTITGLFDHYWLTLIQNQIMLTTLLSLSYSFSKPPSFDF